MHCNPKLREANVGSPVGDIDLANGIWKCTQNDALAAIGQSAALPEDFMVVNGVCVWTKGAGGRARGIQGEVRKGKFEIVDKDKVHDAWDELMKQELLTAWTLAKNLALAKDAWSAAGDFPQNIDESKKNEEIMDGIGEGYDEEDESVVFKTDVKVADLSDDALRSWVATFLLGSPVLG